MPKDELLPGVTSSVCPPAVVCDARKAIKSARRRALARDVAQVTVLLAVDWLFARWPEAHIPALSRNQSLTVLEAVNAMIAAHIWCTRLILPQWAAKRISTTWSRAEQQRFTRLR